MIGRAADQHGRRPRLFSGPPLSAMRPCARYFLMRARKSLTSSGGMGMAVAGCTGFDTHDQTGWAAAPAHTAARMASSDTVSPALTLSSSQVPACSSPHSAT